MAVVHVRVEHLCFLSSEQLASTAPGPDHHDMVLRVEKGKRFNALVSEPI